MNDITKVLICEDNPIFTSVVPDVTTLKLIGNYGELMNKDKIKVISHTAVTDNLSTKNRESYETLQAKRNRQFLALGIERALKKAGFGRNSPCTCGSGIKYKKCHSLKIRDMKISENILLDELGLIHETTQHDDRHGSNYTGLKPTKPTSLRLMAGTIMTMSETYK